MFLAFAYEQGDLSRVYPIARGAAPLIVLAVSTLFLAAPLATAEVVGIIVLGLGIVLMGRGAFLSGESRRLVPLALGSAAATAGYSIVDGMGARVAGDAILYVGWLFALDAALFLPVILVIRGRAVFRVSRAGWTLGAFSAAASYGAYMIGWLVFGDRLDRLKAGAAALIVSGVAATRV